MYLIADTETSDKLKPHLPLADESQPWIVSVSAKLVDSKRQTMDFFRTRIRANGRKIRPGAEAVHGITSADASRSGVPEIVALAMLMHFASQAKYVVTYGDFDQRVVESVLIRAKRDPKLWVRPGLQFLNPMLAATPLCKLAPKETREDGQHKWPSLDEACDILLGESPRQGHHHDWEDLLRCERLFFNMLDRGVFDIAKEAA